jgi:hypothetical protein
MSVSYWLNTETGFNDIHVPMAAEDFVKFSNIDKMLRKNANLLNAEILKKIISIASKR